MRRKLLLSGIVLFVLLCFSLVSSAKAASMWSKTYGTGNSWACSAIATPDGGYAIVGVNGDDIYGIRLVKTDALGNVEWDRGLEGGWASSLVATPDGGYAIAGWCYVSDVPEETDFLLIKTDALGNVQWSKTYGNGDGEFEDFSLAHSLIVTSDGGYAIAGTTNGGLGREIVGGDVWLVKTDASGNMQWNKTYAKTRGMDTPFSLVATSDGGYAIAGADDGDFWLGKTDAFGDVQWNQTYEGTEAASATSLIATSEGGYAIAGYTSSFDGVGPDFYCGDDVWFVKTDALGNLQWNQTYGGIGWCWACSVIAAPDGGYTIAGTWNCTGGSMGLDYYGTIYDGDFWLVKTDENGILPEYSSLLVPALLLTTTAFIIINKKRLLCGSS